MSIVPNKYRQSYIHRRLSGEIELSTFYDPRDTISPGVCVLSEVHRRDKANHIRIAVLPRNNPDQFSAFIRSSIKEGSIIYFDRESKSNVYAVDKYKLRSSNVHKFPSCELILRDLISKSNSSSNESQKKITSVIIKELVWEKNRWVNDISFDELLRNIMSDR